MFENDILDLDLCWQCDYNASVLTVLSNKKLTEKIIVCTLKTV